MAGADNPYENAHAESFWSRLKAELPLGAGFDNLTQARSQLFEYIEAYYNTRRLHSALGYQSPVEFERQFYQTLFSPTSTRIVSG